MFVRKKGDNLNEDILKNFLREKKAKPHSAM